MGAVLCHYEFSKCNALEYCILDWIEVHVACCTVTKSGCVNDLHLCLVFSNVDSRVDDPLLLHLCICFLSNCQLQIAGLPVAGTHVVLPVKS